MNDGLGDLGLRLAAAALRRRTFAATATSTAMTATTFSAGEGHKGYKETQK